MSAIHYAIWCMGNIWGYVLQMLPCVCLAPLAYAAVLPYRRRRLKRLGLVSSKCRESALLLFMMFCAGLVALTLFPAGFWTVARWTTVLKGEQRLFPAVDWQLQLATLQLHPFQEILRGLRGGWVLFLVIANVGIFIPVGFFTALLWRRPRWWRSLFAGFLTSGFIELVQFFIGRSSDIDDIILNTAGAFVGFWVFAVVNALFPRLAAQFQCRERTEL